MDEFIGFGFSGRSEDEVSVRLKFLDWEMIFWKYSDIIELQNERRNIKKFFYNGDSKSAWRWFLANK